MRNKMTIEEAVAVKSSWLDDFAPATGALEKSLTLRQKII